MGAPHPLPAVAGAKTKNVPYLSSFPRRGVWGEPTKNGKEIFGFCFAASDYEKSNLILTFLFALFSVLAAIRGASSPSLVVALNFCGFGDWSW